MTVEIPSVFIENKDVEGYRPRTGKIYNFTIRGSLEATSLGGKHFTSDTGSKIAVQVILCKLGAAGFCSPFVSVCLLEPRVSLSLQFDLTFSSFRCTNNRICEMPETT